MKVFALTVLKDEIDIVHEFLDATIRWIDKIFILDNGSTDGTWEAVKERENNQIVVLKRSEDVYSRGMVGELFRNYRHLAASGDWWCQVDADEIYMHNPREWLRKVKWPFGFVYTNFYEYVISLEDLENSEFQNNFKADMDRIKYLKPFSWVERRFFKERPDLSWPDGKRAFKHAGIPYPKMMSARHYQLRSPQQAEKRHKNRMHAINKSSEIHFEHVPQNSWKDQLINRSDLILDEGIESFKKIPMKNKPKLIDRSWYEIKFKLSKMKKKIFC